MKSCYRSIWCAASLALLACASEPEDLATKTSPIWDLAHDKSPGYIVWNSGNEKNLSTWHSVDCVDERGDNALLVGLHGFKEPQGNLDQFLARLEVTCRDYVSNAADRYDPSGQAQSVHEVYSDEHDTGAYAAIPAVVDHIPTGIEIRYNPNSYVKNIQLRYNEIDANNEIPDDDGDEAGWTTGHDSGGKLTVLGCNNDKVLTGVSLKYSTNTGKVRIIRAHCRSLNHTAENIEEVLDAPGTAGWEDLCGTPREEPTDGGEGIQLCGPTERCMDRVTIDNFEFPLAVCNDGSPGTFFVAAADGTANLDKWVIHLQGGKVCRDYESCRDRWCGRQPELPYTANKMSTDWDGDGTSDLHAKAKSGGMSNLNMPGINPYRDWNHVWVYYCSSDSWLGRATNVEYVDDASMNAGPSFSIHHRGHNILEAVRSMLRRTNANPNWNPDEATVLLPDLDDATDVLFTGTSAGGKGAAMHADWFLAPLGASNKKLIVDANFDTTDAAGTAANLHVDTAGGCDPGTTDLVDWATWRRAEAFAEFTEGWHGAMNAYIDESCEQDFMSLGLFHECMWMDRLLTTSVSIPTFVRTDLEDGALAARYMNGAEGCFFNWDPAGTSIPVATNMSNFTTNMRASMIEVRDAVGSPVEAIFGPRCQEHVGLEKDPPFAFHRTPDTENSQTAPQHRFRDLLTDWTPLAGTANSAVDNALAMKAGACNAPAP